MSTVLYNNEVNEVDGIVFKVDTVIEFYDDNLSIETTSKAHQGKEQITYQETVAFLQSEKVLELRDLLLSKYPISQYPVKTQ